MNTLVMKFGGSSIGTTDALTQVLSIVLHESEQWNQLVLVVSALEGVTDGLIEAAHLAQLGQQRGYRRIVANLRTRHLALIDELPLGTTERAVLYADIDRLLFEMLDIYQGMAQITSKVTPEAVDATIGVGEKLAARIVAALLRQNNLRSVALDTTSLIVTDDVPGNATANLALTRAQIAQNLLPLLERKIVPVVTGFIGATSTGKPTTLGRGGSDYTASVMAVCTNASEIWIWTDVDGMMTADPRDFPEARVIPILSYDEAAEMAYFGARVLHTRMISPLREDKIALRVKNVYKPQQVGTLIQDTSGPRSQALKAIAYIPGLAVEAKRTGEGVSTQGIYAKAAAAAPNTQIDLITSSQSATHSIACFLIPTTAGSDAIHTTRLALEENLHASAETQSWTVKNITFITAISATIDNWSATTAVLLKALSNIRLLALSHGPSNSSLTMVVENKDAEDVLHAVHSFIINPNS
ncbi:MAG: aspartate kinase [Chloroflexi bacterium]|nr:aspartate kinase [Chloroflexota bacterium]MCC6895536.1 aspartate kinase [Anaerolineae bacterium]